MSEKLKKLKSQIGNPTHQQAATTATTTSQGHGNLKYKLKTKNLKVQRPKGKEAKAL